MNQEYNLVGMIRVLIKWKKYLIGVPIAATLLVGVYSFLYMDDYYMSYATFYPVNLALNDRRTMFNVNATNPIDFYGSKEDVNRILSISQSRPLQSYLVHKYNLAAHYKIDTTSRYWKTKVSKTLEKNYKAIKTEQNAVELSIYDTDPAIAAAMVNEALMLIDSMNKSTIYEANKQQVKLFTKQMQEQKTKVETYADTLADLGERYHISVKAGANGIELVEGNDYKAVQRYKAILVSQRNSMTELNNGTNIMEHIQASVDAQTNSLSIVTPAVVADRKEKPVRSLICITVFMITLIVSVFGVFAIERIEVLRKEI
jgi:capsular polysaccharide biosynthesis protein